MKRKPSKKEEKRKRKKEAYYMRIQHQFWEKTTKVGRKVLLQVL